MPTRAALIVVAAGSGERFSSEGNKVYTNLAGRPVLSYALEASRTGNETIGLVVIVAKKDDISVASEIANDMVPNIPFRIVTGGATRQESEYAGLEAVADDIADSGLDVVAIHDAARPFLTRNLLETIVQTAADRGGAVPGLEPTDAMWAIEEGERPQPIDKRSIRAVQTPQAFSAAPLLTAYRSAAADGFMGPDTAATVVRYTDLDIAIVPGDARNIKITHPDDVHHARHLVRDWAAAQWLT